MEYRLNAPELLRDRRERVLLDVRSPGEYAQGHIPGAVSFPLFSNDERAQVGTVYKQKGPDAALELGLVFVGPKMAGFVQQANILAPDRKIAVHCWRGGKRSQSVAWLLRMAGFDVATLAGGYKFYRRHVLDSFENNRLPLRIIGGRTGSGKTKILHALREQGEQVIDLEAIAHHKGSAFGAIGEAPQPTVEQFENDLFDAIDLLDPMRTVWVENESRSIGKVYIPGAFWNKMKVAPLYNIEIPDAARLENLLQDYVLTDKTDLQAAFLKIDRKLGGQQLKNALEALQNDDFATAARIALHYYDKTYQHCLDINLSPDIKHFVFERGDPTEIAVTLRNSL